jgi:hypothetical protein
VLMKHAERSVTENLIDTLKELAKKYIG